MIDEPIKARENKDHMGGFRYSHPCFGKIRVHNLTGSSSNLFGSEVEVTNIVAISINESEVTQDLGKNWYYANKKIVEAWMTPVQYAEMIASPNNEGIPCTLRYRVDKGHIVNKNIASMTEYAKTELDEQADKVSVVINSLVSEVSEILEKKGSLKKSDRLECLKLVKKMVREAGTNFEFRQKCVKQNLERATMEAKSEIDHHITHAIAKLGAETLNCPDAIKLVLGNDSKLLPDESGE